MSKQSDIKIKKLEETVRELKEELAIANGKNSELKKPKKVYKQHHYDIDPK